MPVGFSFPLVGACSHVGYCWLVIWGLLYAGFQSKELILKAGLVLGDVDQYPDIDVTIDGADE